MLRGGVVVVIALALVAASGTEAGSSSAPLSGFNVVASENLYSGVNYANLTRTTRPVVAHVAHVAPGAPVDLRVVNAHDKISTNVRQLEPTSSMCRRVRCIVGVNGDFHKLGVPAGAVVIDRRMLHSPDPARPQLTITAGGRLVAGPLPWAGSVSAHGIQIPVAAINPDPFTGGLALFTPAFGGRTDASTRTELVVRAPGGVGVLNQPAALEPIGLRSGAGPIPGDGAVLSADGPAAQQLKDLWARHQAAPSVRAQLAVTSPVDAVASLGAEPVVLRDGQRALPWRDPNLIYPRQPHTLVGWNKAGDVYLVAVDGRQSDSDGMTMAEAADFLLGLGATDAVNLDGGGGTTFVAGGTVWNRPSDKDPTRPAEFDERGATNALVVTARPGSPLPPTAPATPKPVPPMPVTTTPGIGWTVVAPGLGSPPGGVGSGFFGPSLGVGRGVTPGDLPLGSASAGRSTPWPGLPTAGAPDHQPAPEPGDGSPPTTTTDPTSGPTGSGSGPGSEETITLAASLPREIVDTGSEGLGLAAAAGLLAVAAAGGLFGVTFVRRRRLGFCG